MALLRRGGAAWLVIAAVAVACTKAPTDPTGINTPQTLAEIAPSMAKTLSSVIVAALEGSLSAATHDQPLGVLASLFALLLPEPVYASSTEARCAAGGTVHLSGISASSGQYSLANGSAVVTNCSWLNNGSFPTANGSLGTSGVWCPGQGSCNGLNTPVGVAGFLSVTGPGSVLVNGSIGLTGYAVSIGGAGLQQGAPDTPPPPNPDSCDATVAPSSVNPGTSGGTFTIAVTVGATCSWTAGTSSSFITVTAGTSGKGNGAVTFAVAANSGASRSGSVTIAGKTVTVNQSGSALNVTGNWLVAITNSASSNGTFTATLTQTGNTITGEASTTPPATDKFTGTVSGSTITALQEIFTYNDSLNGTSVTCKATINYTITSASNTLLLGTFASSTQCTISSPVPIPPLPATLDSGNARFTKQ